MNLKNTLVVIPARGGSKGVPGKNIKPLSGKPMIYYTLEAARQVFSDDQIYVSTDDHRIKKVVEDFGLVVPFIRPSELATDEATTYDVLLHSLRHAESCGLSPEILVLLQPTSPFRTAEHIRNALPLFHKDIDMVVSVVKTKSNPYFTLFEESENGFLVKSKGGIFSRRQECPTVWELNGAIYIISVKSLKQGPLNQFSKVRKFPMDEISSHDIDSHLDWLVAEKMFEVGLRK